MDGSNDCTMSLRKWQKLAAARMGRRVPALEEGLEAAGRVVVRVIV